MHSRDSAKGRLLSIKTHLTSKSYTMEQVSQHDNEDSCWIVINGEVIDATSLIDSHPGGRAAIIRYAGKDASKEFNMFHLPDVVHKFAPETVKGVLNINNV